MDMPVPLVIVLCALFLQCLTQTFETIPQPPDFDMFEEPLHREHHHMHKPWSEDEEELYPPDKKYPVQHAGVPRDLQVYPLPLEGSDHELMFNVSWSPPLDFPARDYSLEVSSVTDTVDCMKPLMCYEYNIPGDTLWWVVPAFVNPVEESCSVRPGCAYAVVLTAHPWDGRTVAEKIVELDECVAGVCSCAHSPRLPTPLVSAQAVVVHGEIYINVSWTLPPPKYPQRLSRDLLKQNYVISIGKQMVTDAAHPSPWFANTISRHVDADGRVADGDGFRWLLLPTSDRRGGIEERDRRERGKGRLVLDVKLLARVSLVDERGCLGPAGNATAYDPSEAHKIQFSTYIVWATIGGACMLVMVAVFAMSVRLVKRVLSALRPSAPAPLAPLRLRPAWLPLQQRTSTEAPSRGQMEQSPLYVQKEFETDEVVDVWEVSRRRVHLGALIGSGAFGRVHAAQLDMPGGETIMVAAKMLTENATEEEMQDFLREIVMLKHVGSHKHVIRLIACCTRHAPLIALLEHAPRGDLLTLLRSARGRRKEHGSSVTRRADSEPRRSEADTEYTNLSDSDPTLSEGKLYVEGETLKSRDHYVAEPALQLDSATMRDYALQVAMGMSHLEERGITHRDLAARNILVDGAGVLKVADFGLSRVGVYVHTRSRPVPLRWLAPEAILHSQYCNASDVWAFAVLLWEIATLGGFPYAELSNHQVPPFLAGGGRLPKPARASPRLYELMVECWSEEPQDRPTFANIVDKLSVQRQLYVDLDSLLSPDEEVAFDDYEFMIPNVIIKATNILLLISGIFGWPWPRADDPLLFIENPVEAEMPGHWLPLSIVKIILERSTKPVQHKIQLKLTITRPRSTTTTTEATTTTTEATSTTTEATSTTTEATTTPTTTLHTTPEETTTTTEPATTTKPATATTEPPTTTTTTLEPTTTTTSTTTTEPTTTTTTEPTTTTTTPTTTTTTEPPTTTTTPTTTTEPPTTTTTPTTTSTTEPTTTTTTTTEATTAATGRKTPRRKTNKRPDSHDNMQA